MSEKETNKETTAAMAESDAAEKKKSVSGGGMAKVGAFPVSPSSEAQAPPRMEKQPTIARIDDDADDCQDDEAKTEEASNVAKRATDDQPREILLRYASLTFELPEVPTSSGLSAL
ncbi:expressed unknown protein [Seminavis robusta]|uniref:Uncharacterized protein n=1 Tax=Seminavis robusta TaxID=568900 RepID=A0A9N8F614_9STRA|nr:expressed unknown protein [Seminavis robusta]|eukprot:Sro3840_g351370.1 n/a (116) ;mRNA; r:86-433